VLVDQAYKGLAAEVIFGRLPQPQPPGDDEGEDEDGSGNSPGEGKPSDKPGKDPADIPGAVFDAPEPAQSEAEWRVAVQQAAKTATAMGSMPGALKGLVEEITKPKIDWKPIMRRFFQQSASADYSWSMPNRRYVSQGIYLPELRSDEMPPVIVYLDTSASTQPFMAAFIAELQSVIDECQPERVYLVHTDTQVQGVEVFERGERLETVTPLGLGGTDFRPAFEWAENEDLRPACAVWLTDGEGRYPEFAPEYPVLWCLSQNYKTPWGENVVIQ
jgi:predicted metal-dependent peptidase